MEKEKRIEVWYDATNMRGFPHVKAKTIKDKGDGFLYFTYGSKSSTVCVNKAKVFFIDVMDEED